MAAGVKIARSIGRRALICSYNSAQRCSVPYARKPSIDEDKPAVNCRPS